MKRLLIIGVVLAVALLGCQSMDKGMDDEMEKDDDMKSGSMSLLLLDERLS